MFESLLAVDEGFEPPILGPEPSALPLGQSPIISAVSEGIITKFVSKGQAVI